MFIKFIHMWEYSYSKLTALLLILYTDFTLMHLVVYASNHLPLICSRRSDRYTYIYVPYVISIHRCSFLLTLQGYCRVLKQILGSDKSLNSLLQRGYEF